VEMRDSVADPRYVAKLQLSARLTEWAPHHFMSRYRMVTFTQWPYAYAYERGRAQNQLLEHLLREHSDHRDITADIAVPALKKVLDPLPSLRRDSETAPSRTIDQELLQSM
jgi:kynurenine 3-monooxygenase